MIFSERKGKKQRREIRSILIQNLFSIPDIYLKNLCYFDDFGLKILPEMDP